MELVRTPPPALMSLQRALLVITSVAVAGTRIWARSATLWDWDETLFCLGVEKFDVVQHHPHPPGFPLYIALAKAVRLVVHSDFHALQAIVTAAAIALFPLLFWLAYELRFPFRTAYLGSLLFVFLPNVWFYGGTAFSDVPALAFKLAACAMLLRGCRDRRAYFAGAVLLGLAASIRYEALLFGCVPALLASWCRIRERRWRDVAGAALIGIAILGVSYGAVAANSESIAAYRHVMAEYRHYVATVDSFVNPARAPLPSLLPLFFVREIPGGRIIGLIAVLALLSIVIAVIRRNASVWLLMSIFLPFNLLCWLLLDVNSVSRYSVTYVPMYALLAADGLALVPLAQAIVIVAITARIAWWTVPALRDVRHTASPPVAAVRWIHANLPHTAKLYVHGSMAPWEAYMLRDFDTTSVLEPQDLPKRALSPNEWYFTEASSAVIGAHVFIRDRGPLFDIARQRYFEVSLFPASDVWQFGDGWYGEEAVGLAWWRWMSGHSTTLLPPLAGNAQLTLGFDVPAELVAKHPSIAIAMNGTRVDQFTITTTSVKKSWIVPARADRWNELTITLDRVVNPAKEHISDDARDLGLNLTSYSWTAAP